MTDQTVEIQLNSIGMNSIDISKKIVDVCIGESLHLKLWNYGTTTHVTLRCNAPDYTDFTSENIYIWSGQERDIKIKSTARTGKFNIQIISGYGVRRENLIINVIEPKKLEPMLVPASIPQKNIFDTLAGKILIIPLITAIIAIIWYAGYLNISEDLMVFIVYLLMLGGIIVTSILKEDRKYK
ncbi:MAG TPA: hypothetical protein O0X14_02385 [Methanocorpusculum sp.]|nr:hypothetical protein [Methanocorpusculum sp.]